MIKVYPAVFELDPVGYGIYFPDVEGAVTQAQTISEGLMNASDALGIMLSHSLESGEKLPLPSDVNEIEIDKEKQFVTLVSVDLSDYLKENTLGKKTIKIPHWLNVRAKKEGINFSQTMTEALEEKLNL